MPCKFTDPQFIVLHSTPVGTWPHKGHTIRPSLIKSRRDGLQSPVVGVQRFGGEVTAWHDDGSRDSYACMPPSPITPHGMRKLWTFYWNPNHPERLPREDEDRHLLHIWQYPGEVIRIPAYCQHTVTTCGPPTEGVWVYGAYDNDSHTSDLLALRYYTYRVILPADDLRTLVNYAYGIATGQDMEESDKSAEATKWIVDQHSIRVVANGGNMQRDTIGRKKRKRYT